jgi:hypothetical protein
MLLLFMHLATAPYVRDGWIAGGRVESLGRYCTYCMTGQHNDESLDCTSMLMVPWYPVLTYVCGVYRLLQPAEVMSADQCGETLRFSALWHV